MGEHTGTAKALVADLPVNDGADGESDLISLIDVVVTAVEHDEFMHFRVRAYSPSAAGTEEAPWAVLQRLADANMGLRSIKITADGVREAAERYIESRLEGGMSLDEARRLVDGSYTDVIIADAIIQFAVYGKVIYG